MGAQVAVEELRGAPAPVPADQQHPDAASSSEVLDRPTVDVDAVDLTAVSERLVERRRRREQLLLELETARAARRRRRERPTQT